MEGFTYTNIFETKALEYLIIVFFFALLIPFWMLISGKRKSEVKASSVPRFLATESLKLPHGIFFSKYHTWAHLEKNGEAKVGLDDLLLHLTGKVEIKYFKVPGDEIHKGEMLARLHHNGNRLEVFSPVTGRISHVNELLEHNPQLVKDDPYRHGWIYSLKPSNWMADIHSCFLAEDAVAWAKDELVRFKDFLAVSSSGNLSQQAEVVMQDGGEIIEKALVHFPQEVWQEFQEKFLS